MNNTDVRKIIDAAMQDLAEGDVIVHRAEQELPPAPTFEELRPPPSMSEKISAIILSERAGRWVLAAAGLAKLREDYQSFNPQTMPADERTWPDFARKHSPFGYARVNELVGRMVLRGAALRCTSCGAGAICACGCGAPYAVDHPWAAETARAASALDRAMAAIAAHPEKSDRAIATLIGVGHQTVGRARQKMAGGARSVDHPLDHPTEQERDPQRSSEPEQRADPSQRSDPQ